MKQIGIIGAGKVGFSFGKYLSQAGFFGTQLGVFSKSSASASAAAAFTGARSYDSLPDLVANSDLVLITVPDGQISAVWEQCKTLDIADKIFCHCSGALASTVFEGIEGKHASGYSIHPLMAVSDPYTAYQQFSDILFTLEGTTQRLQEVHTFFTDLGLTVQIIDQKNKLHYHATASLASNCMVGLTALAIHNLMECGFSFENAQKALKPLMTLNLANALEKSPVEALTGPVERGDLGTVFGHLSVFSGRDQEVYRLLSQEILQLAKEKHPDRNYDSLENLLQVSNRRKDD